MCTAAVQAFALREPQTQTPPQTQQPQQPVFRTEIDVIRLDVSVLDKDRKPIRGLTADDFTVLENGKAQRIVAVSEIDAVESDRRPSPWMRAVPRDVTYNDLTDQVGDGRLFAIVMDDVNIPWDSVAAARGVGRYLVDMLGPSDVAAVVYPGNAGRSQDFTENRDRLVAAVDRFERRDPDYIPFGNTDYRPGPGGGDMPQRFSPVLGPTNCERRQPIVPAFETVVSRLATVPDKRKTVFFVSGGVFIDFASRDECLKSLGDRMQDVFRDAQRANINIHSIDPAGYRGPGNSRNARRNFLEIMADDTGGRAVVNSDDVLGGIDALFAEGSTYYLVGYQTSNGEPDGKFRKVEVKVNQRGANVRTRSGYYAPKAGELESRAARNAPSSNDLKRVGLMSASGLPMRAVATSVALAGDGPDAEVAVALTVRLPPPTGPIEETVTVLRNTYDERGNTGPMTTDTRTMLLQATRGDELRYDVFYRMQLPPGRHELRLHASSSALQKSGTVFVEVEVQDFTRSGLVMTGVTLGTAVDTEDPAADGPTNDSVLAPIVPIRPTTAREFSPNERPMAFLRVYQGGSTPLAPVTLDTQILDVNDQQVFHRTDAIAPEVFDARRGVAYQIQLQLESLRHGPYLLSIRATTPGSPPVRRDMVFRVR